MELQHILTYALKRSFGYCVGNELEFRQENTLIAFVAIQVKEMVGGPGCWQWRGARFEIHFAGLVAGLHMCQDYGEEV